MSRAVTMIAILAASLALAACQQQPKPAPQVPVAVPPAPASSAVPTAGPEAPAPKAQATPAAVQVPAPSQPAPPKPAAAVAKAPASPAPAKPAATAAEAPKPATPTAVTAPKPAAVAMPVFSTTRCMACHAIDHDKVGPAWKTVVEKYGDAATLARDFEGGFKERRVANAIAKWKPKEGLMTSQFNNLIKGHEKEAAHALFETVKHGKFGSY